MLCSVASPSYGTSLEGITTRFQTLTTDLKKIPTERRSEVLQYITSHRSGQYKAVEKLDSIELQDLYLSDPRLPSHSGALTGRLRSVGYLHTEYVEIPTWANNLLLLRRGNYTLTDRGKVLLALQPDGKINYSLAKMEVNPFLLAPAEKYFFLYCILETDGDLIRRLYARLVTLNSSFGNNEVGRELSESLKDLQRELTGRARSEASRILKAAEASIKSGQIIAPRLEPLVDCGLLRRADPVQHLYEFTEGARGFVHNLNSASSVGEFLDRYLAANTAELLRLKSTKSKECISRFISKSYLQLRSGLGYCSIRELALLAVGNSLSEGEFFFEIGEVEQEIMELFRTYGPRVRFTKNRQGQLALVRIESSLSQTLYDKQ